MFSLLQNHSVREFASGRLSPVLVVSYEMAVRSLSELQRCQFDLMVCDEGHRLKNAAIKTATVRDGTIGGGEVRSAVFWLVKVWRTVMVVEIKGRAVLLSLKRPQ